MSRWKKLWQPSRRWWLLFLPPGALLAALFGAAGWLAFDATLHLTSANAFCYSCHVGMDTIVEEYQASGHYRNQTGIIATCADCHIPREFIPKMRVKIVATADIYHALTGKITLQNFESHRLALAMTVREDMKATDSRECRNCHDPDRWDVAAQSARARMQHDREFWAAKKKTCINCHHGVAHLMPLRPGTLVPTSAGSSAANPDQGTGAARPQK